MAGKSRPYSKAEQQKRRLELLPHAYGKRCPRCGLPMLKGQALDLGHTTPAALHAGRVGDRIEHASCNRADGAAVRDALAKYRRPRGARA